MHGDKTIGYHLSCSQNMKGVLGKYQMYTISLMTHSRNVGNIRGMLLIPFWERGRTFGLGRMIPSLIINVICSGNVKMYSKSTKGCMTSLVTHFENMGNIQRMLLRLRRMRFKNAHVQSE